MKETYTSILKKHDGRRTTGEIRVSQRSGDIPREVGNESQGNINLSEAPKATATVALLPSDCERRGTPGSGSGGGGGGANRRATASHLAEGFEKYEQLKILYLYQCYNLQKILRTKLNPFGRNQITR